MKKLLLILLSFLAFDRANGATTYETPALLNVTLVSAGWLASELLKGSLVPSGCRWCDRGPAGEEGLNGLDNGVRSALRWQNTKTADLLSYVTLASVLPLTTLGLGAVMGGGESSRAAVLVVVESALVAGALTQLAKFIAVRSRPYAHFGTEPAESPDSRLSFFSGHTSIAFALATAAGVVTDSHPFAPVIWAVGLSLAGATAYLRIAADRHYFTDVLTGAVVGSSIGVLIPALRRKSDNAVQAHFSPSLVTFSLRW